MTLIINFIIKICCCVFWFEILGFEQHWEQRVMLTLIVDLHVINKEIYAAIFVLIIISTFYVSKIHYN